MREPKKKRIKIPKYIEAEVIFKSDFQCCVCKKRGDQIHHLDEDPSNNTFDNLAFLCHDDHNDATITRSLNKKLTKEAILRYRQHHYLVIENRRQKELGVFNRSINELSEEVLLTASKNALIIFEVEKMQRKYFSAEWKERESILSEIEIFSNHSNFRVSFEIFKFLSIAAAQTRGGMPYGVASYIFDLICGYFPSIGFEEDKDKSNQLAKQCIHIGENIAYDAFIHLNNLAVAMSGLTIIKFIDHLAKENNIVELSEECVEVYNKLKSTLDRPERNDLGCNPPQN